MQKDRLLKELSIKTNGGGDNNGENGFHTQRSLTMSPKSRNTNLHLDLSFPQLERSLSKSKQNLVPLTEYWAES